MAALVSVVLVTGCSPDASPSPPPVTVSTEVAQPQAPLDGVYRMDVAADQNLANGVPAPQEPYSREYAIRSACGEQGCVAAVTRLDDDDTRGERGPQTPLDYVGDQWVTAEYSTAPCGDSTAVVFGQWQLTPQADGSLVGTRTVASFGSGECTFLWSMPMTVTRTGDIGSDVEIDDPASVEPRKQYAAAALSGAYDITSTVTTPIQATPTSTAAQVSTLCARTSDRCLTLLENIGGNPQSVVAMLFADEMWTSAAVWPDPPCEETAGIDTTPGGPPEMTTSLDLPQPTPSPITTVTGTRKTDNEGCFPSLYTETLSLKRTGD